MCYNQIMDKKISDKIINRLTLYHCILQDYLNSGETYISSGQIAALLGIDDSQVRKDISILNNSGKSRIGYIVSELKKSIEKTLGFSKTKKAFMLAGSIISIVQVLMMVLGGFILMAAMCIGLRISVRVQKKILSCIKKNYLLYLSYLIIRGLLR